MKSVLTTTAFALLLVTQIARAEDKTSPPSMTLDNCAKVTIEVQKVDRPNGTVWLQSVTCTGYATAPKVHDTSSSLIWHQGTTCMGFNCSN